MDDATENVEEQKEPGAALVWVLALLIFGVYFFVSTRSTIWDRDEARFCRATDEMIWSSPKNYLYPTFQGELRPDKPILIYWMMSIPVSIFGRVEWAYRLWAVLATVCSCVLTYKIGLTLFSRSAGLWATGILATNGLVAFVGAVGTTDAVLLAEMTWMALLFARVLKGEGFGILRVIGLTVLVAMGMLTKGPVALLPVVVFLIARPLLKKEIGCPKLDMLKTGVAALAGVGIFFAWFIPANNATNGEFLRQAFGHHIVDRVTTSLEHHSGYGMDFAYYFIVIFAAFFPWTFFLPAALVRTSKRTYGGRVGKVFLFTWMGLVMVVMIAIRTKLPHYILPMWPALALMCGCLISEYKAIPYWEYDVEHTPRTPSGGWFGLGGFLFLLAALALGGGLAYGPEYFKERMPEWGNFFPSSAHIRSVIGALIALVCFPIGVRWRARHAAWNARVLIVGFFAFLIGSSWLLLAEFEKLKISDKVAAIVRQRAQPNTPVVLTNYYDEASLIFYLEKHPIANLSKEREEGRKALERAVQAGTISTFDNQRVFAEALSIWAGKAEPGVIVIGKSDNEAAKAVTSVPVLNVLDEVSGVNYSKKGKFIELLVLKRSE